MTTETETTMATTTTDAPPVEQPTTSRMPTEIDPKRLARAKTLTVRPLGGLRYEVTGGSQPRVVDLGTEHQLPCGCPDQIHRFPTACAHTLAVIIHRVAREGR